MFHKIALILALLSAALFENASGQVVSMRVKAETNVGCFANLGTSNDLKLANRGTTWTQDTSVRASVGLYNDCTTSIVYRTPNSMSLVVVGGALRSKDGTARSNSTRSDGSMESHTVRVELHAKAAPVHGLLVLRMTGSIWKQSQRDGAFAWSKAAVGTTRLSWQHKDPAIEKVIPVTVPSSGLTVSIESLGAGISNQGPATYRVQTDVDFFAGRCMTLPYGRSCATVSAWYAKPRLLRMSVASTARNGVGVTLVGLQKRSVPLPTPYLGCIVLVEPIFTFIPFSVDSSGRGAQDLEIPAGRGQMLTQVLLISPSSGKTTLATTNGLATECR